MTDGSTWWSRHVPSNLGESYTQEILTAIERGDAVFEWITIEDGELQFEIMRAPLAIGCFDDHVFLLGLSGEAVDLIALALEEQGEPVMSPTPRLWDLAAQDPRQVQVGPHTLPTLLGKAHGPAGMTKTAAKAHADAIASSRPGPRTLISGACKTIVLHPYTADPSDHVRDDYVCQYGWRLPGKVGWGSRAATGSGYVVEPASWAHNYLHYFGYEMGAVFVRAQARLGGRSVDLRDLVLAGAHEPRVAPAGPVPFVIHPLCRGAVQGVSEPPDTEPAPIARSTRPIIGIGSKGEDVGEWQRILMLAGFSLAPWNADEKFGKLTHNATVGFQRERGLSGSGLVDLETWEAQYNEPVERPEPDGGITDKIIATNYTRIVRVIVDLIVVHTIEAVEASTTGDNTARWFASGKKHAPRASAHYCFDDDSTILCVPEESIAWAAPGANHNGLQFEHAGFARQRTEEWFDPFSRRMLARSAKRAAVSSARWDIPIEFVDAAGLMRGERGITTHYQVTKGPGKGHTTHTDPGRGFPMSTYLGMIREAA